MLCSRQNEPPQRPLPGSKQEHGAKGLPKHVCGYMRLPVGPLHEPLETVINEDRRQYKESVASAPNRKLVSDGRTVVERNSENNWYIQNFLPRSWPCFVSARIGHCLKYFSACLTVFIDAFHPSLFSENAWVPLKKHVFVLLLIYKFLQVDQVPTDP